jgi:hypothetical protein
MAELTINDIQIPLGDKKLVFSKAGYSFNKWLTKEIPISERVRLPETSLLNSIFKRPNNTDITGSKFSKFYRFKYTDNSKIVASGTAKLLSFSDNKEYEIQLIDGSFILFEALKNDLNALDVDSSDFIFNAGSYTTLKTLNSSLWIWSASSMHEDKILTKNILNGNLSYSRPYFSARRLLEKMFDNNGWSYNLGVNTTDIDNLIISAKSEFVFTSYDKEFNTSVTAGNIDLSSPDFINGDTVLPIDQLNLANKSKLRLRGNAKFNLSPSIKASLIMT